MQLPDKETCRKGAVVALENAKALLEDADHLAQVGRFGRASALVILAGEESVKAIVMKWAAITPVTDGLNWSEVFYSHKAKQGVLALGTVFGGILETLVPIFEEALPVFLEAMPTDGAFPEGFAREWVERKLSDPEVMGELERRMEAANQFASWWHDRADAVKQNGFYVQFSAPNVWASPLEMERVEYESIRNRVVSHIRNAEMWIREDSPWDTGEWQEVIRSIGHWAGLMWLTLDKKRRNETVPSAR